MPNWITHLMIADRILELLPDLDRRGFSVGSIAPDCNVENEDWTRFEPSREQTHWMSADRKVASDSDAFCDEYILNSKRDIDSAEQYAFLLGYYAHLITDAAFQWFIRDEERVRAVWSRIKRDKRLCELAGAYDETWDSVKHLIPREERRAEIFLIEGAYLKKRPDSAYLTEILPLKDFPDYIDYLPPGSYVRKIAVMGYLPIVDENSREPVSISREEYASFVSDTIDLVLIKFREKGLIKTSLEYL